MTNCSCSVRTERFRAISGGVIMSFSLSLREVPSSTFSQFSKNNAIGMAHTLFFLKEIYVFIVLFFNFP